MSPDGFAERVEDPGGREVRVRAHDIERPLGAAHRAGAVWASVTPSVNSASRSPGSSAGPCSVTKPRPRTGRAPRPSSQLHPDVSGAVEDVAGHVPGVGAPDAAGARVDRHNDHADEPVLAEVGHEQRVHLRQDPGRIGLRAARGRPHQRAHLRHQDGRVEPVAADIADDEAERATGQGQEIEVVAAGRVRGNRHAPRVEAGDARRRRRKQALLDLPGEAQTVLEVHGLSPFGHVLGDGDQVGDRPVGRLQGRDGLTRQVDLAVLPAVGDRVAEHLAPEQLLPEILVEAPE